MDEAGKKRTQPHLGDWSMSDEREFMESLLCQRFNFFLILFSLVLTAAFTTTNQTNRAVLLLVGGFVCLAVWLTIYRAHVKHHWIMQHLYRRPEHPAAIVNDEMKKRPGSLFSVSRYIGVVIPVSCTVLLVILGVLVAVGALPNG